MRYIPHSDDEIRSMLEVIGRESVEDLFASIPDSARFKGDLPMDDSKSELEVIRAMETLAGENAPANTLRFLGAGANPHFQPSFVDQMLLRSEFYTAYTPYQPEISQGTLQAIFEYQSMVAALFGVDVANASMYDGATAMAEAALMAIRVGRGKRNKVLMAANIHPEWRQVTRTYMVEHLENLVEIPFDTTTGLIDQAALAAELDNNTACVIAGYPSFFGTVEDLGPIAEMAHNAKALMVAAVAEPAALGFLKTPGSLGADIVVGEGLGFVGGSNYGGPGVGLFACNKKFMRQMPGRLCGATTDAEGKRGFVLTLSTREQHIRRDKATSNICTNQGLMALAFGMTTAWYGSKGFWELARKNHARLTQLKTMLTQAGMSVIFTAPAFNECAVRIKGNAADAVKALADTGIVPGLALGRFYPELGEDALLIAVNEMHTSDDLDRLVAALAKLQ